MNAGPLLLRRTSTFVCRSCRSRQQLQESTGRQLFRRHLSTTRAAAFQAYTLPSQQPPSRPRNADAPETSITIPIDSPLPRVHETRHPDAAKQRSRGDGEMRDRGVIPEGEAQRSKSEFVGSSSSSSLEQSLPEQSGAGSTPTLPAPESKVAAAAAAAAATTTTTTTTEATTAATAQPSTSAAPSPPKRSKLRAPRKAAMRLTPSAVEQLRALLEGPDPKLIKVGVRNRGCSGLAYHLEYVDKAGPFDEAVEQDGVRVLIDSKALFSIIGSEMDWAEDKLSQRFVFRNPNIKEECGCGESFMV